MSKIGGRLRPKLHVVFGTRDFHYVVCDLVVAVDQVFLLSAIS
jgi:hypothetical protein